MPLFCVLRRSKAFLTIRSYYPIGRLKAIKSRLITNEITPLAGCTKIVHFSGTGFVHSNSYARIIILDGLCKSPFFENRLTDIQPGLLKTALL